MTAGAPSPRLGDTLSVLDAARDAPARLALVTDSGELTFAELAARVESRAAALAAAGLLDDDGERPVSFDAHPSLDVVVTVLALLHAGTPAFPLHPRLTEPEKVALEARAGAMRLDAASLPPSTSSGVVRSAVSDPERIAALIATSGSTGTPRIARLSHRALVASAHASTLHIGVADDDRMLLALPLAHVGGLMVLVRTLAARRTLVLFDPGPSLLGRLPALAEALVRRRITQLSLVPTVLDRLLEPDVGLVPGSLRVLLVGGAPSSPRLLARAHERGLPVLTTYGLTEACAQVATRPYADRHRSPADVKDGAVGVPLSGVKLRIVDGVVELGGPTLFSGYVGEPGSEPSGGWLRTGDHGIITPQGELALHGRASDLIITGGENVDPVEVELALEALSGVAEACVLGLPDTTFGESIAVAFVPRGPAPKPEHLLIGLQSKLARHKLPRRWLAVDALPKLPSGKLDRRRVRERYQGELAGAPTPAVGSVPDRASR
jgi:o-succinylbenzoate---CoA ligase